MVWFLGSLLVGKEGVDYIDFIVVVIKVMIGLL